MVSLKRFDGCPRSAVLVAFVTLLVVTTLCAQVAAEDDLFQFEVQLNLWPEQSAFDLDVWVEPQELTVGDAVRIYARPSRDATSTYSTSTPAAKFTR